MFGVLTGYGAASSTTLHGYAAADGRRSMLLYRVDVRHLRTGHNYALRTGAISEQSPIPALSDSGHNPLSARIAWVCVVIGPVLI